MFKKRDFFPDESFCMYSNLYSCMLLRIDLEAVLFNPLAHYDGESAQIKSNYLGQS